MLGGHDRLMDGLISLRARDIADCLEWNYLSLMKLSTSCGTL